MSNDAVYLDASGWIALLNTDDRLHQATVEVWREIVSRKRAVVLTDWIIAETGNGLARTPRRDAFARAVRLLPMNAEFQVVMIDDDLMMRAIDLYQARLDKSWGLVDCASFVVMTEQEIREALTADHHFEQAGFRRLLSGTTRRGGETNGTAR